MRSQRLGRLIENWEKLTSGSINRQIFGNALTVGFLTLFVKIGAIGKELVIAWRFGAGDDLDAFFIALVIPTFIINVLAGAFKAALIPSYIWVREKEGKKASQKLFSGAMIWSLGLLVITTIFMISAAPLYLPKIAPRFDPQKLDLTFQLLYAIAPIILLSGIISILGAVLNAGEHFRLAALSPLITPIITVILLMGFKSWGVFALVGGLICGALLEIVILVIGLYKQDISLTPIYYRLDSHLYQVFSQFTPMIFGSLLVCSSEPIDQIMAAMFADGSLAILNYGNRVTASPISLISVALSTAILPYLSKMIACQDWLAVSRTLNRYLKLIFLTTVPLTGVLIAFSEPIVKLLFQRGLFTYQDTQLVAQVQSFYALQIPFYIGNILLIKMLISMQAKYILISISGLNVIMNIIFNYLFIQWLGIKGIALSTSCVYLLSFLYASLWTNKLMKKQCHSQEYSQKL